MSDDRNTFDGDLHHMDELVLHDVTAHIERTSHHDWYIMLTRNDVTFHAYFQNLLINVNDFTGLQTVEEPLIGCDVEWGYLPNRHRCDEETNRPHRVHVCECGDKR